VSPAAAAGFSRSVSQRQKRTSPISPSESSVCAAARIGERAALAEGGLPHKHELCLRQDERLFAKDVKSLLERRRDEPGVHGRRGADVREIECLARQELLRCFIEA
jgi:hypothetical protein